MSTYHRPLRWNASWLREAEAQVGGLVAQSCLTLCGPMDCRPPGSSVHGILQARILEWVAIFFSRGSPPLKDRTQVSCIAGRFFTAWAPGKLLQTGGPWNKPNTDSEPGKARWLAKGNPEEMPHLGPPVSLSLFLPKKYFPSLCGNSFLHSRWAKALSLATVPSGPVIRILRFHCHR